MIFTTYSYAVFLLSVFVSHWAVPRRARSWLLIAASYFFYATWRWPYLALLLAVTLFNWAYARFFLRSDGSRPLWPGITVNIGILLYFKYTNFLVQNAATVLQGLGLDWSPDILNITLPLGVSFFTFQGIAYLVDVASGEEPFESLRDFMLYKSLWPQLIAGPIIRPGEIRTQIEAPRVLAYEDVSEGVRRILLGAFKKIVLADTLAQHVDLAFLGQGTPHALDTIAGVVGFGFQVYFDFSAYSDFAIGSARLFGFRFPENFDWPYVSTSPQDFWNRWHMTLSRWIRDYVFTPLSFASRARPQLRVFWLIVAMALCGLWHGAEWTFVLWGVWHGGFLALQQTALRWLFVPSGRGRAALAWLSTMLVVFAGWLFFRAPSLANVAEHLGALASLNGGLRPALIRENGVLAIGIIALLSLLAGLLEKPLRSAWQRCASVPFLSPWLRPAFYALLLVMVIVLDQEAKAFVYFQF